MSGLLLILGTLMVIAAGGFAGAGAAHLLGGGRATAFTVVGLVLGVVAGSVSYAALKRYEREVRAGWNLVPVVVAAVDIQPGTVVTFDMISQRSIPDQFATQSMVKPDSASYVVNHRAAGPMFAGDPIIWDLVCGAK